MADFIELEVVSSNRVILEKTEIKELYIPAFRGEAGILENHLPYISLLSMGEVSYLDPRDRRHYLYIEDGFVESADNRIAIVSDTVVPGEELDAEAIPAKLTAIRARIKSSLKGEISAEELAVALEEEKRLNIKAGIIKKQAG
jgi:ATP synthase F1 epsilon subunit